MQFNPIAFAATKAFIDSKSLVGPQDSSSIAVVASMLGNPVVSLFAGQSMAEKKAAEQASPAPSPAPAATGVPVAVATVSPAASSTGGAPASPGVPAATLPTSSELDRLMKDMTARANEFIEKAEQQLKEVREAAMDAAKAAREAREAALATLAKVQDGGPVNTAYDPGAGSLVGAGGKSGKKS